MRKRMLSSSPSAHWTEPRHPSCRTASSVSVKVLINWWKILQIRLPFHHRSHPSHPATLVPPLFPFFYGSFLLLHRPPKECSIFSTYSYRRQSGLASIKREQNRNVSKFLKRWHLIVLRKAANESLIGNLAGGRAIMPVLLQPNTPNKTVSFRMLFSRSWDRYALVVDQRLPWGGSVSKNGKGSIFVKFVLNWKFLENIIHSASGKNVIPQLWGYLSDGF